VADLAARLEGICATPVSLKRMSELESGFPLRTGVRSMSIEPKSAMQWSTHDLEELRRQLQKGAIPNAYRALLSYISELQAHFARKLGARAVSALYQGYMDMTYFALFPPALKRRGLKIAVVFNYDTFRFEAWLAARNRKLQQQYWQMFSQRRWANCRVSSPATGVDSILERDLAKDFDLHDPSSLTRRIDSETSKFIACIEHSLRKRKRAVN
jgi:hypothetical protein